MRVGLIVAVLALGVALGASGYSPTVPKGSPPTHAEIVQAFAKQGIRINAAEAQGIRDDVLQALEESRAHGIGNSKVDFAAVQIASELGLDTSPGSTTVRNAVAAVKHLPDPAPSSTGPRVTPPQPLPPNEDWERYFDQTVNL